MPIRTPPAGGGNSVPYDGFPMWAKIAIVLLGLLGGGSAVTVSLWQASDLHRALAYSGDDVELLIGMREAAAQPEGTPIEFTVHALNAQTHLKAVTNRQAIGVVSVGAGIALLAIGFSLFVIGADGAFKVHMASDKDAKVILYGTAPGLLCFLLGAIVVLAAAYTTRYELQLGEYRSAVQPPATSDGPMSAPKLSEEAKHVLGPK